jgi:uncharacterized delta-60 repeat protein
MLMGKVMVGRALRGAFEQVDPLTDPARYYRLRAGAWWALIVILALVLAPFALHSTPVDAFGPNNSWLLLPEGNRLRYNAVAQRPDNGYVVAGVNDQYREIWVTAVDANGNSNRSFGNGGSASVSYGLHTNVTAATIAPDGKILVTGDINNDFFVVRFTADGRPDPTFGVNGKSALINFQTSTFLGRTSYERGHDLFVQPDGKIVVAGRGGDCGVTTCEGKGLALIRLHADGRLDSSFGNNGKRLTTFSPGSSGGSSDGGITRLIRLRGGRLLAIGWAKVDGANRLAIARYTATGDLDKSFHFDGKESYAGFTAGVDAVELPDGKVLITTGSGQVLSILPDGRQELLFGTGGKTTLNSFSPRRLHVQADGRILVLGAFRSTTFGIEAAVARLTGNGQLDRSFGNGLGMVSHAAFSLAGNRLSATVVNDAFVQADGRLTFLTYNHEFTPDNKLLLLDYLLRLTPTGAQDVANTPPLPAIPSGFAVDDTYTTLQGQTRTIATPGVLANDRSPSGSPLRAGIATLPLNGRLTLLASGAFSYTPNSGFVGTDRFTYVAGDGQGASATASVTIKVNPISGNTAPGSGNVGYDLLEDTALVIPAPGVLTNDLDPDGDRLEAELVGFPEHGQVELNIDGSYVYTPNPGFVGTDFFYYRAYDGLDWSETTTVTLRVAAAGTNVPPIAVGDLFIVQRDSELTVEAPGVIANDQDHNGDAVTVTLVEEKGPAHGTLELWPDGSFVYTPADGFVGEDSFTYALSDGVSAKQTTVRIFVVAELTANPPDDDPTEEIERPEPEPEPAPEWRIYLPFLQR